MTLSELLLVLFLMTIVFITTIPSQEIFIEKSKEHVISTQLLRAINLARNEAITRGLLVILGKNKTWQQGYVMSVEGKIIYTFQNPTHQGVLSWRAARQQDNVQFLPTGITNTDNGTFWYCRQNIPTWAIVISKVGRARIVYPNQSGEINLRPLDPVHC